MTIYRSALISRREGLSEARFRDHWIRIHGELASHLPGVGTYRQNHIAERFHEAGDVPVQAIDGISQLAFDSIAAMEVSDASPEYARVKADIPLFQGGITILVLQAERLFGSERLERGRHPAKLLWLSTRRAGVPADGLQARWLRESAAAGVAVPGARRQVQNFVVDRSHPVHAGVPAGSADAVEALSELWFDDVEALRAGLASPAGQRLVHGDPLLAPIAAYRIEEIHII
ncbi:EthD family reductase [Xenophilus sp.]|uniref:EthD family reductase n=1 Tax=Xenophilus sp. TaxID=1873499 RepID=UPI0037DBF8E5